PSVGPNRAMKSASVLWSAATVGGGPSSIRPCSRAMVNVVTPICSPCKGEGAARIGQHVAIVADQMLALAGGQRVAADRGAEARQQQRAHQLFHGVEVAVHQLLG